MNRPRPQDHYAILGVAPTASPRVIQDAFRKLAQRFHPDHAGEQGTRLFQKILQAYEVLSDPAQRRRYNQSIRQGTEPPASTVVSRPSQAKFYPPQAKFYPPRFSATPEPLVRRAAESFSEAAPQERFRDIADPTPFRSCVYIWLREL